jgi:hypothetical protein
VTEHMANPHTQNSGRAPFDLETHVAKTFVFAHGVTVSLGLTNSTPSIAMLLALSRLRSIGKVVPVYLIDTADAASEDTARKLKSLCNRLGLELQVMIKDGRQRNEQLREFSHIIALGTCMEDRLRAFCTAMADDNPIARLADVPMEKDRHNGFVWRPLLKIEKCVLSHYLRDNHVEIDDWVDDSPAMVDGDVETLLSADRFRSGALAVIEMYERALRKSAWLDDVDNEVWPAMNLWRPYTSNPTHFARAIEAWLSLNQVELPSRAELDEIARNLSSPTLAYRRPLQRDPFNRVLCAHNWQAVLIPAPRLELSPDFRVDWGGEFEIPLPHGLGRFRMARNCGFCGIKPELVEEPGWWVGPLKLGAKITRNGIRRRVRADMAQVRVPFWERIRLPVIYHNDAIVCVPHLPIRDDYAAEDGQPSVIAIWYRDLPPW